MADDRKNFIILKDPLSVLDTLKRHRSKIQQFITEQAGTAISKAQK